MSFMATFLMIPILLLIIAIPIIIGIYVWRDANRRGMSAPLWTLVAVFAPTFIGLIIYLIVRGNYSDLHCPQCDTPVKPEFVVCPKCGAKLKPTCQGCGYGVESDWKVCPHCAAPITEEQSDYTPPVRAKDKSLSKVVLVVILIPVLLFVCMILGLTVYTGVGSSSFTGMTTQAYFEETNSEEVREWMAELDAELNHAYALRYDHTIDDDTQYYFLVYVPGVNEQSAGIGHSSGLFGTSLTLNLQQTNNGDAIFCVTSSSDKAPKLNVKINGKRVPCDLTVVDYNPTTYYIVPQYDELEPGATDFFMPERISVVKLENNQNVGVKEVIPEDLGLDILIGIDSAEYLEIDHPLYGNLDFSDGYEIIIEYEIHDDLLSHPDMLRCAIMEQDGEYYIMDDRVEEGKWIRQVDDEFKDDFYPLLESLFEE